MYQVPARTSYQVRAVVSNLSLKRYVYTTSWNDAFTKLVVFGMPVSTAVVYSVRTGGIDRSCKSNLPHGVLTLHFLTRTVCSVGAQLLLLYSSPFDNHRGRWRTPKNLQP